ncbi:MAG: choice-of-anchor J domain-containing protein [Firmicutes bacterium]|nr:choice-of-anchor J domain-containing protein [Bacillota bacterium]
MKLTASISRSLFAILLVFILVFGVFGAAPAVADSVTTYTFEEGLDGWTTIDADGDGHNWFWTTDLSSIDAYYSELNWDEVDHYHDSPGSVMSASYSNGFGELRPNNYLVSPKVELGGSISFYTCPLDDNYVNEKLGVFVSTGSNTNAADFVEVQSWTLTADHWKQYTADLSAFSGEGYVAIRHYDSYDVYMCMVDDITITEPVQTHVHDFTYSADGATLTATCSEEGCDLPDGKVSFSIVAPEKTHYGDGKSAEATLSGVDAFNEATGLQVSAESIQYVGRGDTEYDYSETAPTLPGTYTAGIVAGEDDTYRNVVAATVDYEILPAELTITADPKEKTVGENDPELTYTAAGLVEGDTITGALTRAPGEDPGEYDILIGTISAGDNYTIKYVGAKLTIKAKDEPKPPVDPEEPDDPEVPKTGDDSGIMLYVAMMLVSISSLAAITLKKRYNK